MSMMRVGRCPAIFFLGGCLDHVDCLNGGGGEYVFDTDVHGGSWQGIRPSTLSSERGGQLGWPPESIEDSDSCRKGSLFRVNPSPRLRLGIFNGRRLGRVQRTMEPPAVSRFLYRPAL